MTEIWKGLEGGAERGREDDPEIEINYFYL